MTARGDDELVRALLDDIVVLRGGIAARDEAPVAAMGVGDGVAERCQLLAIELHSVRSVHDKVRSSAGVSGDVRINGRQHRGRVSEQPGDLASYLLLDTIPLGTGVRKLMQRLGPTQGKSHRLK
jgi:hypothetical protein